MAQQLKDKNQNAAAVLYEVYYRDLHYYVLKRVHDPEMADAMAREIFIELFETIDTLSDVNDFIEWSRQIADRRCEEYRNMRKTLLSGKVGSEVVSSIEGERKKLRSEEIEQDVAFLTPEAKQKSHIGTGAKLIESIGRKVLVGVLAALILTMINNIGLNWLHIGGVSESTEEESTEQMETAQMTETDENLSVSATEGVFSAPEETESQSIAPEETEPSTPEETENRPIAPETTRAEPVTQAATTSAPTEPEETAPEETEPEETVLLDLYLNCWKVVGFVATKGTDMVVPATYEGFPVTSIGEFAMAYHGMLTSVQLPDGIDTIHRAAFQHCEQLKSINLPESILYISAYAFNGCSSLEGIVLPSLLYEIPEAAFMGCSSLTEMIIPEGVKSIGDDAFAGCTGITEIRIPASVRSISSRAFRDCDNLVKIVAAEENQVYYSEGNCLLTKAGNKLILCGNDSVIPSDGRITSIGEFALVNCREWMELVIPDGVQEIGAHACDNLRIWKVTIPVSVTGIETWAFGLTNVSTIVYGGTMEQWNAIEKAKDWAVGCSYTVYCTDGQLNEWGAVN